MITTRFIELIQNNYTFKITIPLKNRLEGICVLGIYYEIILTLINAMQV
jgi:hypothetical protein